MIGRDGRHNIGVNFKDGFQTFFTRASGPCIKARLREKCIDILGATRRFKKILFNYFSPDFQTNLEPYPMCLFPLIVKVRKA